jgi:hypothetical protein
MQVTYKKERIIWNKMKAAQDRHKSYANTRWRPLKFHEGNKMFLKVTL